MNNKKVDYLNSLSASIHLFIASLLLNKSGEMFNLNEINQMYNSYLSSKRLDSESINTIKTHIDTLTSYNLMTHISNQKYKHNSLNFDVIRLICHIDNIM